MILFSVATTLRVYFQSATLKGVTLVFHHMGGITMTRTIGIAVIGMGHVFRADGRTFSPRSPRSRPHSDRLRGDGPADLRCAVSGFSLTTTCRNNRGSRRSKGPIYRPARQFPSTVVAKSVDVASSKGQRAGSLPIPIETPRETALGIDRRST